MPDHKPPEMIFSTAGAESRVVQHDLEDAIKHLQTALELTRLVDQMPAQEVHRLLNEVYALVFIEAVYDPLSDVTRAFAQKLWPLLTRLNEIIHFKK